MSHGTESPTYILKEDTNSLLVKKKESKKDSDVPDVPGTIEPKDDWPDDYLGVFWFQFPVGRKTGKKAVGLKLGRIRKSREVAFADLMAGVARYAGTNPDPKYTKSPEVWLNKGCWADEYSNQGGENGKAGGNGGKIGFSGIAARLRRHIQEEQRGDENSSLFDIDATDNMQRNGR